MRRRTVLQSALGLPAWAQLQPATRRPNFIVILADDLGYNDLACFGSPDVATPHIDSIARNGVRFTDGYVSCAVSSPSRAALLTGCYQHRFGHEFNPGPPEREAEVNFGLPSGATIAPQFLKAAGYSSAIIGKWHLGIRPGYHPLDRGFDEFYGFLGGANAYVTTKTPGARAEAADNQPARVPHTRPAPIFRGKEPVEENRYLTDAFAQEALRFIERHRDRPFFLYLALNAVHTPLHATERYLNRVRSIKNDKHRFLAAMTSAMDDAVGAVLEKLRELDLERHTLLFFLSDNGCPVMTGAGSNHPLNGEKCTYFEGGIRVPFLAQWPGRIPAGLVYREPVVSRDLLPTMFAAAAIRPPEGVSFDGVDLLPFLNGTRKGAPHETLFWRAGQARAVRAGNWKLVEFGEQYSALFDLSEDVGERNDLASKHSTVVRKLRQSWKDWSAAMSPPRWPPRYREIEVNGRHLTWEL